ncbi:hypothetical protein VD659_02110 [Herbiconiux sp. 11R-BC]|uniref:hypothetical protein n=1 Tax=Herbiconiux sp. 11R-BC TaxID=3111637 RepID=UPI003BFFC13A
MANVGGIPSMQAGLAPAILARAVLVTGTCVDVVSDPGTRATSETWEFRLHLGDGDGLVVAVDRVALPSPTTAEVLHEAARAIYEPHGLTIAHISARPRLGVFTAQVHRAPPPS